MDSGGSLQKARARQDFLIDELLARIAVQAQIMREARAERNRLVGLAFDAGVARKLIADAAEMTVQNVHAIARHITGTTGV